MLFIITVLDLITQFVTYNHTDHCTGVHVAGARSGARLSGAGARCGVGQCPVCATHPPPAPPAPGSVGQSRGSVIITDGGLWPVCSGYCC